MKRCSENPAKISEGVTMRSVRFLKSIPALLLFLSEVSGLSAQTPIYLDSTAAIEDRVDDLLARMSLDEKIGQMTQADRSVLNNHDHVRLYYLGSILSGGGSVSYGTQVLLNTLSRRS